MTPTDDYLQLGALEWVARGIVEGYLAGRHRSPYRGFSVEYLDHRPYSPGDPPRSIDWKVFARTDKYQVKLFRDETNLRATLLLDGSASMAFPTTGLSKWHYAVRLVAALGYLFLSQRDAVGAAILNEQIQRELPPSSRTDQFGQLIHLLESFAPSGGTRLPELLHDLAERRARRGPVILVSDLLTPERELIEALRHLRQARGEVIVLHLLDPAEIDFSFRDRCEFLDAESAARFIAEPAMVRRGYRERLQAWLETLEQGCQDRNLFYKQVRNGESFLDVLAAVVENRGRSG